MSQTGLKAGTTTGLTDDGPSVEQRAQPTLMIGHTPYYLHVKEMHFKARSARVSSRHAENGAGAEYAFEVGIFPGQAETDIGLKP